MVRKKPALTAKRSTKPPGKSPARSSELSDPNRVVEVAKSVTWGMSRPKTLALWRNVIARFPTEVAFARQYVFELMLSEGWVEMDAFAAAAQRHRSSALDLNYLDAALVRLDLDSAGRLVERYAKRYGRSSELLLREYDLHSLRGDFTEAAKVAVALRRADPAAAAQADLMARRARFYRGAKTTAQRKRRPPRDYDVFVVNLDSDVQRMRRMESQLGDAAYTRIPGVKGAYLPEYVLRTISRNEGQRQKGTMGCFMSHLVVWERVVASGRTALVLEDDACIIAGLPSVLPELPRNFDLCFVNERMLPPDYDRWEGFETLSTRAVAALKPSDWSSAGTDGYIVSPRGAAILLALAEADGIAGDVDWRLISYSLTKPERTRLIKRGGFCGESLAFHERFRSPRALLRCHVLAPAIVRQFAGGSVRLWDNEMAHSHVATASELLARRNRRKAGK